MKLTYIAIAAVAPTLLLSGGTLTWNGGETWDSQTASWVDETGEPSVWTDGSVASFPDGGTIALAADVRVSSLLVGGQSFTLSGEGVLRVEEGGAIVSSTPDATIACPVQTAGALSVQSGNELISGIEGVYLSTNEWRKVAEGVSLDTLKNLSILGPVRSGNQVEISLTEARSIKAEVPIRESGDTKGSAPFTLVNPLNGNKVDCEEGMIVAKRHIHMTPKDAEEYGVQNGDIVSVKIESDNGRSAILGDVVIRVSEKYALAMHIDTDESNAVGGKALGVYGTIVKEAF